MKRETLVKKIKALPETEIFTVSFIKRTDGEHRTMVCSLRPDGELPHTGSRRYDPADYNLLTVYDREAEGPPERRWRSINTEYLEAATFGGKTYVVEHGPMRIYNCVWKRGKVDYGCNVRARSHGEALVVLKREQKFKRLPAGLEVTEVKLTQKQGTDA